MGQLSRAEMETAIRDGGSVLYGGQTLWQIGQLPSEADLAEGDPLAEAAVASALDVQIAHLTAQRARFNARGQSATLQPPTSAQGGLAEALGQPAADALTAAGLDTPAALAAASDADLLAIPGIGDATLKKIRATYPAE